jgi:hypothetical protein
LFKFDLVAVVVVRGHQQIRESTEVRYDTGSFSALKGGLIDGVQSLVDFRNLVLKLDILREADARGIPWYSTQLNAKYSQSFKQRV